MTEVLLDLSFSARFDTWAALGGAAAYLAALALISAVLFQWRTTPARATAGHV